MSPAGKEPDAETVKLGRLTDSLGFLLRMAQMDAVQRFEEAPVAEGLDPREFTVLMLVRHNPGLRQGAIGDRLRIKPAHMTKLVRRLAQRDLVRRSILNDDRRAVRLNVTAAGERLVDDSEEAVLSLHRNISPDLAEGEFDELLALLRKLIGVQSE